MPNASATKEVTASLCLTQASAAAGVFNLECRKRGGAVLVIPAATTAAPASWDGALELQPGDKFIGYTIAELWRSSTATHLHCKPLAGPALVTFSSD